MAVKTESESQLVFFVICCITCSLCDIEMRVVWECDCALWNCLSADEKKMVDTVFSNAIDSLSDEDKKLPQVFAISLLLLLTSVETVCLFSRV